MAELESGKWVVGIVIYYIFLIVIVAATGLFQTEILSYNLSNNLLYTQGQCQNPRMFYDTFSGESYESTSYNDNNLECDKSIGVKNDTICNDLEGCEWRNISLTSSAWQRFLCTFYLSSSCEVNVTEYCSGYIDSDSYGIESFTLFPFGKVVSYHNTSIYYDISKAPITALQSNGSDSPCDHDNTVFNRTKCEIFSCSWDVETLSNTLDLEDLDVDKPKIRPVLRAVVSVATFNMLDHTDFGIDNNDDKNDTEELLIIFLLNFFIITLPFILLILAGWFSVR